MSSSAFSLPGPSGSTASTPIKQLGALITQAQDGDAGQLYALAETLEQTHLLHAVQASSLTQDDDESEQRSISSTLSRLAKLTTSHLAQAPYAGAKLATLQLQAEPASARAQPWSAAVLTALLLLSERSNRQRRAAAAGRPYVELLQLAHQLFGAPAKADERAEYKRQVVTPALPRYATALVGMLECTVAEQGSSDVCLPLLAALTTHLVAHPSAYRPHTPRLNKTLQALLYTSASGCSAATQAASVKLAAAPHRTGASARAKANGTGTTDALWAATLAAPLTAAREAWSVVSSAFATSSASQQQRQHEITTDAALFPDTLSSDPLEALEPALERLELLLGNSSRTGVLPLLFTHSTAGYVAVPLDALLSLPLRMLALGPAPAARSPPPDSTLLARQTSALPRSQSSALRLLCAVMLSVPRATLAQRTPEIVASLLELIEFERTSPSLRSSAAAALALALSHRRLESGSAASLTGAALQLDPASPLITRCARVCLAHLAKWIAHPAAVAPEAPASTSGAGASTRKKRARYESDAIGLGSNAVAHGLVVLSLDDARTAHACLEVLTALEPLLGTELTPAHAALRRTFALLLLSLSTLALASPSIDEAQEMLAQHTLDSLAALVREADGASLSLLLARTSHLTSLGLSFPSARVQHAARQVLLAAHVVMQPRLVPRLARAPEERPAEWDVEEGERLGTLTISPDGAHNALVQLGLFAHPPVGEAPYGTGVGSLGSPSHAHASPRSSVPGLPSPHAFHSSSSHAHAHAHAHAGPRNSDPVKPTHRPHTPRIGSPASPERTLIGLGGSVTGTGGASPARAVFGAPPPTTPSVGSLGGGASASGVVSGLGQTALAAPASELPTVVIPSVETKRAAQSAVRAPSAETSQESEEDDEEMPPIDMGDSDEEEKEEEL